MKLIETKGEVRFYEDERTKKQYQQIENGKPFKVKDGKISYIPIKQVNGYSIKYNTNGVYGYVIFRGKTALEDRIWTLADAERIAKEM
jgi:hypothetical protein